MISFLDIKVVKTENGLGTTLFSKERDKNNSLRWDSFDAPQVFRGIPQGQLMRARRICSIDNEYRKNRDRIIEIFLEKGYNRGQLEQTGIEVEHITKEEARRVNKKEPMSDKLKYIP